MSNASNKELEKQLNVARAAAIKGSIEIIKNLNSLIDALEGIGLTVEGSSDKPIGGIYAAMTATVNMTAEIAGLKETDFEELQKMIEDGDAEKLEKMLLKEE